MSEMIERVARAIVELGAPSCHSEICSCSGYEKWYCVLGANPHDLAILAIQTVRDVLHEKHDQTSEHWPTVQLLDEALK